MDLGAGTAFRVESDELEEIRADLADALPRPADAAGQRRLAAARHHPEQGRAARGATLLQELRAAISARGRSRSAALALHRYLGGPWEPLRSAIRSAGAS